MSPSSRRGDKPVRRKAVPAAAAPAPGPADRVAEAGAVPVDGVADDDGADDVEPVEVARPGRSSFGRLGPGAGIAYAVLGFIGSSLLPLGTIEPTDAADVIARELADQRGKISGGILLTLFSLFFLVVFVSWLHHWLRDVSPRGDRWLATLSLVGGTLMVAMMSAVVLLSIASTVLDDYGPDPVIARTLLVLQWQAVAVMFVPTAAFVGSTAFLAYSSRLLPRWLAYSGMFIAVGLLIPPLAFLPFLFSTLWTGMLAVVLLQRSRYG